MTPARARCAIAGAGVGPLTSSTRRRDLRRRGAEPAEGYLVDGGVATALDAEQPRHREAAMGFVPARCEGT
jgi:hypothetical protein